MSLRVLSVQYFEIFSISNLNIGSKIFNFISLYRSSSQIQDEFEKFIKSVELNLKNLCQNSPLVILSVGYLNAKAENWYCHDKCSHEGSAIENVMAQFCLK